MARRRLTLKRIDPWSVLKFGFVANLALLAIWLLGFAVLWFFVQRLELIDAVCGIAFEVGFEQCGVNAGNLFRALVLLGLLAVVVQTGLFVFLAFLHNLIADLVGGLSFSFMEDAPVASRVVTSRSQGRSLADEQPTRAVPPPPIGKQPVGAVGAVGSVAADKAGQDQTASTGGRAGEAGDVKRDVPKSDGETGKQPAYDLFGQRTKPGGGD